MKENSVNVHDDALMVQLGIRPANLEPRDPDVWEKSDKEKKALRRERRIHKNDDSHFHTPRVKSTPVKAKLIIQLLKNDKFPFTTYSSVCELSKIRQVLSQYISDSGDTLVAKYHYNGKEYKPYEFPFWY